VHYQTWEVVADRVRRILRTCSAESRSSGQPTSRARADRPRVRTHARGAPRGTGWRSSAWTRAAVLRQAVDLIDDIQEFYRQSGDEGGRLINHACFRRLYVDDGLVTSDWLAEPFDALMGLRHTWACYGRRRVPVNANGAPKGAAWRSWTSTDLLATGLVASGSSEAVKVEVAGIEPVRTVWNHREPLV
jgi:hypothetical protein